MARISVKKIKDVIPSTRSDDLFSMACLVSLYYPKYSPDEAMEFPLKRLKNMLRVAERQEAVKYMNLLNIAIAPHAEKPDKAVAKLHNIYQEMADE